VKSIQLTENQISVVVNYLLGTELSICAALHACYIDAEEPGWFADELDSISQSYLDERIFKCALCSVWSKMIDSACSAMRNGEMPACKICAMSPVEILYSDVQFVRACGIHTDVLRAGKPLGFAAILFNKMTSRPDCRLQVTDGDLDFLSACGIRVRLSPEDAARRELVTVARRNR
jgi:hypothetical protein